VSTFAAKDGAGAESLSRLAADEVIEPTAFTSLDGAVSGPGHAGVVGRGAQRSWVADQSLRRGRRRGRWVGRHHRAAEDRPPAREL